MNEARLIEALDTTLLFQEINQLVEENDSSSSDDEIYGTYPALLNNVENVGASRKWLKDLLLELSSDSDSEDNLDFDLYLHQTCQLHRNRIVEDSSLSKYMHYSSDLITGENKWVLSQEALARKEPAKKSGSKKSRKLKSLKKSSDLLDDARKADETTMASEQSLSCTLTDSDASHCLNQKKSKAKSSNVSVIRKKLWKSIARKEIPKACRQRYQNKSTKAVLLKKVAKDAQKKVRSRALESRQRSKRESIVSGARRMTREAQLFWKKYSRVEKTQRRKAEKQALVQRKLDDEIREAHRQRRKLNFLITQTELYAHFMNGKLKAEKLKGEVDEEEKRILLQLDQDKEQSTALKMLGETEDEFTQESALSHAQAAFLLHQNKMDAFSNETSDENVDHLTLPQPSMLAGKLTAYQLQGVNWLLGLYMHGLNGILADDMGLGKTVQTIAFFAHLAERVKIWGPFLVVAPASTLNNWHQEFRRFLPSFKVLPYWGNISERKILRMFWNQKPEAMHDKSAPFHVLVTSYQLVVSDVRYFQRIQWQYMVLDEAHALKSTSSIRWRTLLDFNCRNRLLLTGTPIQNTMAELWALLHFIMPTLFDSHSEFNEWFSKDIEYHAENKSNIDEKHLSRLHMILKPFMLRRLKSEVEHELTEKIEIRVLCQLAPRQRSLYDSLQKNITVEDLLQSSNVTSSSNNNSNVLMNLVMQFRKMCNHPDLFQSHDAYSPLHFCLPTYQLPKLIYHSFLNRPFCRRNKSLLYSDYCIHSPSYVHRSIIDDGSFSFLALLGISVGEYWKIFTGEASSRTEYAKSLTKKLQRMVLFQLWKNPRLHCGEFMKGILTVEADETDSDRIKASRTVVVSPNTCDVLSNVTSTSHCLFNLILWNSSPYFYRHVDFSVTYLTRSDHLHSTPSCSGSNAGLANKTIDLQTQSLDEMFQHRLITSRVHCWPSPLPKLFRNLVIPKVYSSFPTIYCNDRHAGHRMRATGPDQEIRRYLSFTPVSIPDRERLVTDSGKLRALDMLLKRLKEGQHRVLIYSQMTKMIDILEEYMVMRRHKYVRLDGSSRISSRRDTVAGFQSSDDIFVFLLSTRAGGLGINLTAADTVIFYDSDWNPTVDQQAMDRAHRLGQTKQVTVYRLVCQGTVDERILERAQEKRSIQQMVISGGNFKTDTLKPKEVVSLLLDDQEMARMVSQRGHEEKISLGGRRGKKRGRKSNREKELERVKRVKELEDLAEGAAGNTTVRHSTSPRAATSSVGDVRSSSQSAEASPSSCVIESNSPSPTSDISRSEESKQQFEDEPVVVDDDDAEPLPPIPVTSAGRGRRARGRPRIRPIMSSRSREVPSTRGMRRGRVRGGGGRRRSRGVFTGRVAAMAGARAGAAAASAAAMAVYGYNYSKRP